MKVNREDDEVQLGYTQLADTEVNKDFMIFSPRDNYQFDIDNAPLFAE